MASKKSDLETELLGCWTEVEAYQKLHEKFVKELALKAADLTKELDNFKRRMISIENMLKDAIGRRANVQIHVDQNLIDQYTQMKKSTKKPVVKIAKDCCSACFNVLPLHDRLMIEQNKLVRCKNCYRMIYQPSD